MGECCGPQAPWLSSACQHLWPPEPDSAALLGPMGPSQLPGKAGRAHSHQAAVEGPLTSPLGRLDRAVGQEPKDRTLCSPFGSSSVSFGPCLT